MDSLILFTSLAFALGCIAFVTFVDDDYITFVDVCFHCLTTLFPAAFVCVLFFMLLWRLLKQLVIMLTADDTPKSFDAHVA